MTPEQTAQVRDLNDKHRTTLEHGTMVMTQGVMAKGMKFMVQAMQQVVTFTEFNGDNDPHGEHDFGKIEQDGEPLFWKIDVFADAECLYGADEPWNPDNSYRVLTLMLASEY